MLCYVMIINPTPDTSFVNLPVVIMVSGMNVVGSQLTHGPKPKLIFQSD